MITLIGQIMAVLAGLVGLATVVYKTWLCPRAKARRQAKKDAIEAIDRGDVTGVTRFFDRIRKPR